MNQVMKRVASHLAFIKFRRTKCILTSLKNVRTLYKVGLLECIAKDGKNKFCHTRTLKQLNRKWKIEICENCDYYSECFAGTLRRLANEMAWPNQTITLRFTLVANSMLGRCYKISLELVVCFRRQVNQSTTESFKSVYQQWKLLMTKNNLWISEKGTFQLRVLRTPHIIGMRDLNVKVGDIKDQEITGKYDFS